MGTKKRIRQQNEGKRYSERCTVVASRIPDHTETKVPTRPLKDWYIGTRTLNKPLKGKRTRGGGPVKSEGSV